MKARGIAKKDGLPDGSNSILARSENWKDERDKTSMLKLEIAYLRDCKTLRI